MTAKRGAGWSAVASILWLLAASAAAQEGYRVQGPGSNGDSLRRMVSGEQRVERPEQQRDGQASPGAARDAEPKAGRNRLSPEERRQLRRDVHNAGRELYQGRMPPGRRELRRQ